jgi:hypothetical protein
MRNSRARLAVGACTIVAALVFAAFPVAAQDRTGTVEISPFAGGYFGGTLYAGSTAIFRGDVDVATAATYGLRVAVNVNNTFAVEASFSGAKPDLDTPSGDTLWGSSGKVGELETYNYELDAVFNFGKGRVIPYFTIGGGLTTMKATVKGSSTSTDTRFSPVMGFGLKVFVTPHVGFRFDGRIRSTYIGSGDGCWDTDHSCSYYHYDSSNWYTNGDVTAGMTFVYQLLES